MGTKTLGIVSVALLVLGVVLALTLGEGRSELGDYRALERAMEGLPGTLGELEALARREDGVGYQARVAAGHAYLSLGDPSRAAGFFQSASSLYTSAEVRLELARALEAAGRGAEALTQWERLLPRLEAVEAVRRLEPDPVRAASLFVASGSFAEALSAVAGVLTPDAHLVRARALAGLGRVEEALPEFRAYLVTRPDDGVAQLEYGQALKRAGKQDQALAAFRTAGAAGAYAAGQLLETLGRPDEAAVAYLVSADPECRWRAARLLEQMGQETEAMAIYVELAQGDHRVSDDASLRLYALSQKHGTDSKTASLPKAFAWIVGDPGPFPVDIKAQDPPAAPPRAVQVASALVEAGRPEWARIELEIALRSASPAAALAIGEWYLAHGDPNRACRIGMKLVPTLPCPRAWRLAYPLAFWEEVGGWAETYGVDPRLVLAVMREESHFSPTAVSSSGARGLMQLMPSTAKWIAEAKLGETFQEEDLFRPETNVKLGTWYLGHLLEQWSGDVAMAVAAYNGGPGNLGRWTEDPTYQGQADFPAVLCFPETREYLTKVLDSWLIYRSLYGG